jgi:hypothetical protein
MISKTKHNYWLDAMIFIAFLLTAATGLLLWRAAPREAGFLRGAWLTIHLCSGIAGLAGVALHVARHRDWLKAMRGRPLGEMARKLRANRILDRILWIAFIAANASGALAWASRAGEGVYLPTLPDRLHVLAGGVLISLTTLHLVFHRKWIAANTRRALHSLRALRASAPSMGD